MSARVENYRANCNVVERNHRAIMKRRLLTQTVVLWILHFYSNTCDEKKNTVFGFG